MKILKNSMKFMVLALFATLISCDEKYPDLGDGLFAEFVTNKGTMIVKLTYEKTPVTVANFVALAEGNHPLVDSTYMGKPFYNGIIFHRVIDKFMIQGGDPKGTGSGSAGYRFGDEFDETLKHDKPGILSMANSGPGTNGSQFFITEVPTPHLNNKHTVFGEVVLGQDIQDSISNVKTISGSKPENDVIIEELNIIRQGFGARRFDAVDTWETELPLLEEKAQQKVEAAQKKAEEAKKVAEEKAKAAADETLLVFNDFKSKAQTRASGLTAYIINKGNGRKPKQGDNVKVWYEAYFADGKLLDSNRKDISEQYGQYNERREKQGGYDTMSMQVSPDAQMISGFKEGVANMEVGEKTYFFIPSHLAYGETGRPPVKPNTDLVFIIELVEISK